MAFTWMFDWANDRYPPHAFRNWVIWQGKTNVLGLEIDGSDGFNSRPPAFRSTFYDTQGKNHASKPADRVVSSSLWVPAAWGDPSLGSRRTDLWIEINPSNSDYSIIGFTNYGGPPRYRVWTEQGGGMWIDLPTLVVYNAWTDFRIEYDGTNFKYFINNVLVQTEASLAPNEIFLDVKIEA